jgi:glycosyltransferase involved in cell wall biosynthesis
VDGLAALKPSLDISLLTCDWGRPLNLPAQFRQVNLGPYRRLPFLLWQQTQMLRRLRADWYLSNFFLPPILPCAGAVAVHDVSFRAHPDYFPKTVAIYMKWLTGLAIRQSARVLTCSEFSRQEIERFYQVESSKIVTMPYGVTADFQPMSGAVDPTQEEAVLSRYGLRRPFIFAIGNIHPRKNLGRLLDAYLQLKVDRTDLPALVWGGLQRWESNNLVERALAAGVVLPGFIEQADLPTLYRQAEMLIYPSLYEGFGLPPVEAMACGTPVIVSNTTSLPEVVGEAGLVVDPLDSAALAAAMAKLLDDQALHQQLKQKGLRRAGQFTWKRTAVELLAALDFQE